MYFAQMIVSCFLGCVIGCVVVRILQKAFSVEENLTIKIKYFTEKHGDLKMVTKSDRGDWIDLYAAEDVTVDANGVIYIPLGVGMALPKGYEAHVLPRSSTPKEDHILMANSEGIIDSCFRGDGDEWHFPAILAPCSDDRGRRCTRAVVKKGQRICQFRIEKVQPDFSFIPVEHLEDADRGGFGSTGRE